MKTEARNTVVSADETTEVRPTPFVRDDGPPSPPPDIEGIRLGASIGSGASSDIFECIDPLSGNRVALKVFHSPLGRDPVRRGRCTYLLAQMEGLELSGFDLPYRRGLTRDGRWYWTSALRDESTLRQLLSANVPATLSLQVLLKLADALCALHSFGLCHGRLHPGNVFARFESRTLSRVGLNDAAIHPLHANPEGIAVADALSIERAFYLAPEQLKGQAGDTAADIYAFSMLIYRVISGNFPYSVTTTSELLEKMHAHGPAHVSKWGAMPDEAAAAIMAGLSPDPTQRPQTIDALRGAMAQLGGYAETPTRTQLSAPVETTVLYMKSTTDFDGSGAQSEPGWASAGQTSAVPSLPEDIAPLVESSSFVPPALARLSEHRRPLIVIGIVLVLIVVFSLIL